MPYRHTTLFQNELLWQLTSSSVESDGWAVGQVPVRAHMIDDVVQNYTVTPR